MRSFMDILRFRITLVSVCDGEIHRSQCICPKEATWLNSAAESVSLVTVLPPTTNHPVGILLLPSVGIGQASQFLSQVMTNASGASVYSDPSWCPEMRLGMASHSITTAVCLLYNYFFDS